MNPFYPQQRIQNGPISMVEQFNQFVSNFRGDPKQKVEELLKTGQMSREEFNQYSQMANNLRGMFRR